MPDNEILPPWVTYPGYPPGDTFWRQSGEAWFHYVWKPYFESLSSEEKELYLKRWNTPEIWQKFYFNEEFQNWLKEVDD